MSIKNTEVHSENLSSGDIKQGYIFTEWDGIIPIKYVEYDGLAIYQGDIILSSADTMAQLTSMLQGQDIKSEDSINKLVKAMGYTGQLWTNARIPYEIDDKFSRSTKNDIQKAIDIFSRDMPVKYVKYSNERYHVVFTLSTEGNSSYVGMQSFNQKICIIDQTSVGTIMHEMAHAAGLWHEQSRTDRNEYVTVYLENVIEKERHNFQIQQYDGRNIHDYDYGSIMHYPKKAFNSNGRDTILPKRNVEIGQREKLSGPDRVGLTVLYPRSDRACYRVKIKTADEALAGTDSSITMTICNDSNSSSGTVLNSLISGNAFERGNTDTAYLTVENIANFNKITLKSDRLYANPDWKVECVEILHGNVNKKFTCNTWISTRDTYTFWEDNLMTDYIIEVKTGNVTGAGTDANISLGFYNRSGDYISKICLNPYISGNAFESDRLDSVSLKLKNIGYISRIVVQSDCKYSGSDWFPDYIQVKCGSLGAWSKFYIREWITDTKEHYYPK